MRHFFLAFAMFATTPATAFADQPTAAQPAERAVDQETPESTAPAMQERDDSWAWVVLLAGAATLAASATFALRASDDHDAWSAARDPRQKALLKDRGQSRAIAADITGATGLLIAGTGALFLWVF